MLNHVWVIYSSLMIVKHAFHNTLTQMYTITTRNRVQINSQPVPSPSGFSIPMAPGSNLSGAYETTTSSKNLKLIIPGPSTGPTTRSAAESPDVRYNHYLLYIVFPCKTNIYLFQCLDSSLFSLYSVEIRITQSGHSGSRRLSKGSREGSRRLSMSSQEAITYPAELPHPPLTPCAQTHICQRSSSYTQLFRDEEYMYPNDTAEEPVATLIDVHDGPPPAYTDMPEPSPTDQSKPRKLDDLVSRFNLLQKKN